MAAASACAKGNARRRWLGAAVLIGSGSMVLGGAVSAALAPVSPTASAELAPARVALREKAELGATTRVVVELKAEGLAKPGDPASAAAEKPAAKAAAKAPKPLGLRVETRFAFDERVRKVDGQGAPVRVVRHAIQAAAAINGQVKPTASALRPEVSLLVSELREGVIVAVSAGGPLTRPELELVEAPGDPLALPALLPEKPVAVGDHWTVASAAARSLSSYDALASNTLEAKLESLDDDKAQVKLSGTIRGAALGGEGAITCAGSFTFDRKAARVSHLTLTRSETRKPGPVEAGLDIKSTLTVERKGIPTPPELSDQALMALPEALAPELEQLLFVAPDGKYSLRHGRDWHIFAEDTQQSVLKRLDHGELVAQCNLATGPNAGKGRHQDLGQFRDDIRRALAGRFDRALESGEVEGPSDGTFRYRVAVAGHEGNVGILWYYYLVASPEGDQLLGTFTLAEAQAKQFGDQDLQLIGSLEWKAPGSSPAQPPAQTETEASAPKSP